MGHTLFRRAALLALAGALHCGLAVLGAVALGAFRPAPNLGLLLGAAPCAAPCWQQITPGATPLDEAVALLQANPALADLVVNVDSATWWWNGQQAPEFQQEAAPFAGRLRFPADATNPPVAGLAVLTRVTLGDLWLALGAPRAQAVYLSEAPAQPGALYAADFGALIAFTTLPCRTQAAALWQTQVGVAYGEVNLALGGPFLRLPAGPPPGALRQVAAWCSF